ATDTDENAIQEARKGIFTEGSIKDVPTYYIQKYFTFKENTRHYQVNSYIRDLISFAVQNIATDPPFSRMHLISCRNLLIYLRRDIQERLINNFYLSLNSGGY